MGLRDRGQRLKGREQPAAAAKPVAAVRSPLVEPSAAKAEAKVSSTPTRSAPKAEALSVIVAPESGSGEVTVQRGAPTKGQETVQDRPVPKTETASSPTQELSLSSIEIAPEPTATRRPVDAAPASETATVAASPVPMQAQKTTIAKFETVGDSASVGAGIKLTLSEMLTTESFKVTVSGGQTESTVLLSKDVQNSLPYLLADGGIVNLVMTYTGRNLSGSLEVGCVVEGAATAFKGSLERVTDGTRSLLDPKSKSRFMPSVIALGSGVAVMIASFTMNSITALGGWQQYGIAALGLAAAAVGVASITARIDHNAKS